MTLLSKTQRREKWVSLAFLLPTLIILLTFVVYPIVFNAQSSLLKWDGINPGQFIGLGNFSELISDPSFILALQNSGLWILLTIVPTSAIGFFFANVLNRQIRGRNIYRAIFFIPSILSPIVVGFVWQRLLDPFSGVLAQLGQSTGLDFLSVPWLSQPNTAIYAVMFVNIWMWSGFSMLFYLAGLQLIDPSVLEAAKIDGASPWHITTLITLPLLRHTHLSLLLLGVIGSLKTFELIYVLTQGGPNHASEMLPTYAFLNAFTLQRVGYGSAISVVLIALSVGVSLLMVRVFGSGFISGRKHND